jgi:hypothetical protein
MTDDRSSTQATSEQALAVAERELRAARAIALDPTCDGALAAGHLAVAWEGLARGTWPPGQVPEDSEQWLRAEDRAALPPRLAQAVDEVLPAVLAARGRGAFEPTPWAVSPAALGRHCDALGLVLARHRRPAPRFHAWRRRGVIIAAVAVLGVLALRPWQSESFGPWRGTYFNRMDFTGQSEVRRDLDLDFDWGNGSPMDVIPNDRFSARWDTCLTIPTARKVAFQLVSDDGSRLEIDGALVVDNWGKHTATSKGETIDLTAGEHHLHVEYFEERNTASVTLLASLDGAAPAPIPRTMLRAPDEDDESPCGE